VPYETTYTEENMLIAVTMHSHILHQWVSTKHGPKCTDHTVAHLCNFCRKSDWYFKKV